MHDVLSIQGLTYFFGANPVLKNISLQVPAGKITLVAGKNGAGKSTLLRLIAGLLTPFAGSISLTIAREEIAYLGHGTALYPQLSALGNLNFWNKLYKKNKPAVYLQELLKLVGLEKFAHEKPKHFSRGMSQRLSLARMLLLAPQLFLFDEPTTGLDVSSRKLLEQEMISARTRGASVFWVSHDVARDQDFADYILWLDDKKVRYFGSPADMPQEEIC